jgi:hypothetical protein
MDLLLGVLSPDDRSVLSVGRIIPTGEILIFVDKIEQVPLSLSLSLSLSKKKPHK